MNKDKIRRCMWANADDDDICIECEEFENCYGG